jgi:hypothetical protein
MVGKLMEVRQMLFCQPIAKVYQLFTLMQHKVGLHILVLLILQLTIMLLLILSLLAAAVVDLAPLM